MGWAGWRPEREWRAGVVNGIALCRYRCSCHPALESRFLGAYNGCVFFSTLFTPGVLDTSTWPSPSLEYLCASWALSASLPRRWLSQQSRSRIHTYEDIYCAGCQQRKGAGTKRPPVPSVRRRRLRRRRSVQYSIHRADQDPVCAIALVPKCDADDAKKNWKAALGSLVAALHRPLFSAAPSPWRLHDAVPPSFSSSPPFAHHPPRWWHLRTSPKHVSSSS